MERLTLQEIKNQVAHEHGYHDWITLLREFEEGQTSARLLMQYEDIAMHRLAEIVAISQIAKCSKYHREGGAILSAPLASDKYKP